MDHTPVPWDTLPSDACYGVIRPGAVFSTFPDWWRSCTLNWIVEDESGALYVGTAGHCVNDGDTAYVPQAWGPGRAFGEVVAREYEGIGRDWAWIRIHDSALDLVDPTLCHWGGPVKDAPASSAGPALQYGWGRVYYEEAATRARPFTAGASPVDAGAEPVFGARTASTLYLVGPGGPGDSGSPVMSADGAPYGFLTHGLTAAAAVDVGRYVIEDAAGVAVGSPDYPVEPHHGSAVWGTTFQAAVAGGEAQLGTTLTLVTSDTPVAPPTP
jgi:hypothetical protein